MKSPIHLKKVLQQNYGKMIYVYFWASWCRPCIQSLPAADSLRKKLKNKNVAFITILMNEDFNKWKKAAEKYQLTDNLTNFVITNQFSSTFIQDINLSTIPRYLLLDQEGVLVHSNAPGPEDPAIRNLIDQYLTN